MAALGYKIIFCDDYSITQMRSKAYNSPEKQGKYIIADSVNGEIRAYDKSTQIEPGYEYTIEYIQLSNATVSNDLV